MSKKNKQISPTLESALKAPLQKGGPKALSTIYCLIAADLLPLVARFLVRHELNFEIAPLRCPDEREQYLLKLSQNEQRTAPIPGFIPDYIGDLPFCHVFQAFSAPDKEVLFLCEYGFRHPFELNEIIKSTTETGLYVSFAGKACENLIIKPLPSMRSGAALIEYDLDLPLKQCDLIQSSDPEKLKIVLRLIDVKPAAGEPVDLLFLEKEEIFWLKELLFQLPDRLFNKIEWAGNQDHLFLFLTETAELSFFPFGQAFKKISDHLFIPLDKEIIPRLEARQLDDIFAVDSSNYAFITGNWRRDMPRSARQPLRQLLTFDKNIQVEFRPDLSPVDFTWEETGLKTADPVLLPESDVEVKDRPAIPESARFAETNAPPPAAGVDNPQALANLNEYAALLRRRGDFLGAATCFSLAGNNLAAADCYAAAARELEADQI